MKKKIYYCPVNRWDCPCWQENGQCAIDWGTPGKSVMISPHSGTPMMNTGLKRRLAKANPPPGRELCNHFVT